MCYPYILSFILISSYLNLEKCQKHNTAKKSKKDSDGNYTTMTIYKEYSYINKCIIKIYFIFYNNLKYNEYHS